MRVGFPVLITFLSIAGVASAEPPSVTRGNKAGHQSAMVDLSEVSPINLSPVPMRFGGPIAPPERSGLVQVGDKGTHAQEGAGIASREVALAMPETQTDRPAAGRRVQERMDMRHVLMSLEPALRGCAGRGGATPAMNLTVKLSVTPAGTVESSEVIDGSSARPELSACIAAVGASARFRAPGGVGASMLIPVSLPAQAEQTSPPTITGPVDPPAASTEASPRGTLPPSEVPSQATKATSP